LFDRNAWRRERYRKNSRFYIERVNEYRRNNKDKRCDSDAKLRNLHKTMAIDRLGGKCSKCGSVDDLVFHHMDPLTKEFTIGEHLSYEINRLFAEVDKCILLCAECHRINHGKGKHNDGLTPKQRWAKKNRKKLNAKYRKKLKEHNLLRSAP
jgi:hypothetical protein